VIDWASASHAGQIKSNAATTAVALWAKPKAAATHTIENAARVK